MLEWLLVVAPVAFSALVFTLAIGSQPVDVALQHITTPEFLEQQGYAPSTLDDIIERNIAEIVGRRRGPLIDGRNRVATDLDGRVRQLTALAVEHACRANGDGLGR